MGCFWMFLYAGNPGLILLGMLGFFGKEAQEMAGFMLFVNGLAVILFAIGYLIYMAIQALTQAF